MFSILIKLIFNFSSFTLLLLFFIFIFISDLLSLPFALFLKFFLRFYLPNIFSKIELRFLIHYLFIFMHFSPMVYSLWQKGPQLLGYIFFFG